MKKVIQYSIPKMDTCFMYVALLICSGCQINGIENLYKFDNRGYICNTAKIFERDGENI
jgi:hypothetical protein